MSQNTGCTTCGTSWFWVLFGNKPNLNFESQAATSRLRKVPNNSQINSWIRDFLSWKSQISSEQNAWVESKHDRQRCHTLCVSYSNPAVQVEAVENGALQTLLTTLATAQQLRVQKKVSTPTQLTVYIQKVGDNTLHRELDKRRQLDLFRFVKMIHLCVCVCSFCLGSVCSGFPLASLPLCTASLPDTWGSAGPVRAVQDWQQWNSAYTHRHHVIRYDYWEGTVNARSCS